MEPITSAEALTRLLDDLGWLEHANCMSLSPPPGGPATPERVELVLRDEVAGSIYDDERTYRVTRLTATGVAEWSFSGEDFYHGTDHCVESAELIETSAGFGFGLDVPTFVWVVADVFECERLPDVTEPMPPWPVDSWLTVTAPRAGLPSPGQWVEGLAREGVEVTWRMLGGPAHPTERVPVDYTGWFLERPARLAEHNYGVFVRYIGVDADHIDITMERKYTDDDLWLSVCRAVGRWFPEGEFDSGGRVFTAGQWLDHLATEGDGKERGRRDELG